MGTGLPLWFGCVWGLVGQGLEEQKDHEKKCYFPLCGLIPF